MQGATPFVNAASQSQTEQRNAELLRPQELPEGGLDRNADWQEAQEYLGTLLDLTAEPDPAGSDQFTLTMYELLQQSATTETL